MSAPNSDIRLPIDHDRIGDLCRRHHIRKLARFGSVLRDDFGPDSDVDLLYAFEPECIPRWGILDVEEELSAMIGRPVGFVAAEPLSPRFAARVFPTARVIFDSGHPNGAPTANCNRSFELLGPA